MQPLTDLPLPEALASAARTMAPAYLRRRLARVNTPFVDGDTATFVYVGEADAVRAVPFMAQFPPIPDLVRLPGTEFWHSTVALPHGSRVEYKLEVAREGRVDRIIDPLNRRTASDPFGSNSVAHGPGYADPTWASPGVDASLGQIETLAVDSAAFGGERTITVYLPGDHSPGPYPTVYLHDGSDLLEFASLATVLDNLIGSGAIQPLVAVLMDPVDRSREYTGLEEHARFVGEEVVPLVTERFLDGDDAGHRIIGGASLGAIATLSTAWRFPDLFDDAVLMSGSFVRALGGPWERGPIFEPVITFMDTFLTEPRAGVARAWVGCGEFEALADDNRAFVPVLSTAGIDVEYVETADGHHWVNWRNMLGQALQQFVSAEGFASR